MVIPVSSPTDIPVPKPSATMIATSPDDLAHVTPPSPRGGRTIPVTAIIVGLAAGAIATLVEPRLSRWLVSATAGLAALGVFCIFGYVIGFLRVGWRADRATLLDSLTDALADPVVVTGARSRVVHANLAYKRLVQRSGTGRVVGMDTLYNGYTEAADKIYRLAQAARDRQPASEELRLAPGSGVAGANATRPIFVRLTVAPLPEDVGKDLTLWRLTDITADRTKQEHAFLNLQHLIGYLDDAPAGFFAAEEDGKLSYVNATLANWLGFSIEETSSGSVKLTDIMSEATALQLQAALPRPGKSVSEIIDLDMRTRDGAALPVTVLHRSDFDSSGARQPSRSVVISKAATARPECDLRLTRFLSTAPIGIAELDGAGAILHLNEAFVLLSAQARRGALVTDMVETGQRKAVEEAIAAARRGEAGVHFAEATILGEPPRMVQFAVTRLTDADEACVLYALDTTENKTLEVQLAQSQKMQAIGQLAGGVAHDFNNVLTAIIGFSDLLLARHKPTDPAFADIMNIKQNANRAANLVRQLLAFSRRQTLRPEVFLLTDALADLGNLLTRLLGEKISFRIVHGRDLWPVKVDVHQLEQVIINLAVNARDAMPAGGTLTVRTYNMAEEESRAINPGLMPQGEYVVCEVEDTGTGIPKEIRDKIWEPFFSTKEVGKGTGLGLSTVYGIVKQTGGFIFLDSEMGRGTIFRIYLPRHIVVPSTEAEEVPEVRKEPRRTDTTGKGTVLLVEDEDAVRAFASRALVSRGYTVLEASSGESALEVMAAHTGDIDLILSDVVMPEMDGPSLLKELRRRGVTTRVIFISGYAEDAFAKNLEGQEDFAFLPKPFSLKQLAEAVKDAMDA